MTKEDVIRMAIEAGGCSDDPSNLLTPTILMKFATQIETLVREDCAKTIEEWSSQFIFQTLAEEIRTGPKLLISE